MKRQTPEQVARLEAVREHLTAALTLAAQAEKADRTVTPAWRRKLETLRQCLGQPALFRELNQ